MEEKSEGRSEREFSVAGYMKNLSLIKVKGTRVCLVSSLVFLSSFLFLHSYARLFFGSCRSPYSNTTAEKDSCPFPLQTHTPPQPFTSSLLPCSAHTLRLRNFFYVVRLPSVADQRNYRVLASHTQSHTVIDVE